MTKLAVNAINITKVETPWGFPTVVKVIIKSANHKWRYIKHVLLVRETSVNGCRLYFGYICGNLCVFYLLLFNILFFCLVYNFNSMIGNVRSLVTNFQYEHRQVKLWRSPSTSRKHSVKAKVQGHTKVTFLHLTVTQIWHVKYFKGQIKVIPLHIYTPRQCPYQVSTTPYGL